MYKYTRIAVAVLLTAGMSAAWAQHSHSPNSSNNDGAPANEATPDSRPQKATAPTAKKQGSTPSAGQGSMQGMDHSQMQGMGQGSMQGMDHSQMQGMGQGSMQGMDHSQMQGMGQGSMQGMDHSQMQGMGQDSMQGMDHSQIQGMEQGSMQGMDHSQMQGMDHGAMQMQGGSAPPDARDPDAYSDGAKLGVGQYAIGPSRSLHMADEHIFTSVLVDRLEWTKGNESNAASYEAQAWIGNAFNKFVIKAEGEVEKGKVPEARTELLWGHAISTYWDTQLGIRNDAGYGRPARNWLAFGVQGLAPYWFEVEATGYVGTEGRTALRLSGEYDLLLTQRLILQPRLEASLYGKNDPEIGIGSGLSSGAVGVRLRYEFSRQFAPYIGIERSQSFGNTANMVRASGGRSGETRFVAGIRMWF
ncbi:MULTISPECIES: copper resistance protein B [unclassified Cupriavidus]|uniref:copper resistance protein B n=2 Tax=Cupriavidus TaxID=106589 RepID=UPI0010F5028E|nr:MULTISPECIES: copper resistance protein B [unclassified Cupriavidus]MWL92130.1 copper resistance protein B [Cupriavidus sp. SW-Y-13]